MAAARAAAFSSSLHDRPGTPAGFVFKKHLTMGPALLAARQRTPPMRLEYFQMITRVVEFDAEKKTLVAAADVPAESPVFEGHFPGYPLLPGVLMIEAMAQTSGWLILGLNGLTAMPFLVGTNTTKMRDFVKPSTPLTVHAELIGDGSGYAVTKAFITREGKRVAEAEIKFAVKTFPDPKFAAMIREWGERLQFPFEKLVAA
jgi:3-hydroxyacyl-[acyl-carrier-protein] dehydratase